MSNFIGAILCIFAIIVFFKVVIPAIATIIYFIEDNAFILIAVLKSSIFIFSIILCFSATKDGTSINYFEEHPNISFLLCAFITLLVFFLAPRKALIIGKNSSEREKYSSTQYYLNLNTGRISGYGGGGCTITDTEYSLLGAKNIIGSGHELAIWNAILGGDYSILFYNRIFQYGEIWIKDFFITKIAVFTMNFYSTLLLMLLTLVGRLSPLLMEMILFPSLFYLYYNWKIYYSFAEIKALGCKKSIFGVRVILDILIIAYNLVCVGNYQNNYVETSIIYVSFMLLSSAFFILKIHNKDYNKFYKSHK